MKTFAKQFYKSKLWKTCRESYLKKVFNICERCDGIAKIVHHKIHLTPGNINTPTITLDHANLEAVCQTCHNREHHAMYKPKHDGGDTLDTGYTFDDDGRIVYAPHPRNGAVTARTETPL
ncbi:MAG: HNH endonuclease [Defluviitaleaceae bacterium]|nr:HNH endonuclease [Defluviitaleaceae bacterium]